MPVFTFVIPGLHERGGTGVVYATTKKKALKLACDLIKNEAFFTEDNAPELCEDDLIEIPINTVSVIDDGRY